MSFRIAVVLFAVLSLQTACGGQVVEFLPDGGHGGGGGGGPTHDGGTDAGVLPPMVTATAPLNDAMNVSVNVKPTATFSQTMNASTLSALTFTLQEGADVVPGAVTLNGLTNTATFTPNAALNAGRRYTATLTTGAKDALGTPLAADFVWSFTTGVCSLTPIALGSAADFAVLARSTVTNTGPTVVTGELGVSPGTAIDGFPPGTVIGAQLAGGPVAAQAITDLTTAYDEAAARSLCAVSVAGNLGGQTLTAGLYKSTSSLSISAGDLTLDAQGDGDAVFIFQTASTLTTASGRQVTLANGAKAANVFWQVGTSSTLGSATDFKGTIMADQAVTLETGAVLNGRALARSAAVTLDGNTVTTPAP